MFGGAPLVNAEARVRTPDRSTPAAQLSSRRVRRRPSGLIRARREGGQFAMSDQIVSALLGTFLGLLSAVVTSFIIPYVQKRMEKVEQKRGIYEKDAQPLAADAVNLLWRLDEILFKQRGQYLSENAPPTPFNQYKLISTCYRIAAILGWIRAIRL